MTDQPAAPARADTTFHQTAQPTHVATAIPFGGKSTRIGVFFARKITYRHNDATGENFYELSSNVDPQNTTDPRTIIIDDVGSDIFKAILEADPRVDDLFRDESRDLYPRLEVTAGDRVLRPTKPNAQLYRVKSWKSMPMSGIESAARDTIRTMDTLHDIGRDAGLARQERIDIIRKWQLRDMNHYIYPAAVELMGAKFIKPSEIYTEETTVELSEQATDDILNDMVAEEEFGEGVAAQAIAEQEARINTQPLVKAASKKVEQTASAVYTPDPTNAPTMSELDAAFPRDEFGNPKDTHWSEILENAERFVDAITPAAQERGIKPSQLIDEACKVLEVDALIDYKGTGKEAVQAILKAWKPAIEKTPSKTGAVDSVGSVEPGITNEAAVASKKADSDGVIESDDKLIDKAQFRKQRTIKIQGQNYLKAGDRVVMFRADHPGWAVETEAVQLSPEFAVFKATVKDDTGKLLATAHGFCTPALSQKVSGRFVEKAETAAVARVLAFVGYGTDDSLDDSDYLSDSPVKAIA
jgi:hypothetical protein